MITEIKEKYNVFEEGIILEVHYKSYFSPPALKGDVIVLIRCKNLLNNYNYETIKLIFKKVQEFRLIENKNRSSTFVPCVLIKKENELFVVDFFPLEYSNDILVENINSDFIIKSKELFYEVVIPHDSSSI